ncbi:MAG: methyltransferase [Bryobacterales bacterium]|nr:methyltransferase [Bryobacterales bacterium]
MTSRERVLTTLRHSQPDRIPIDFGATSVTGMHVSCVAALREYYGLERRMVKIFEPGQMLGWMDEDLKQALGIDVEAIFPRKANYGLILEGWKPWRMYDGLEVLVPGNFNVTIDSNGDTLLHPDGDTGVPPSGRMPAGGYFFDAIIRQQPLEESKLNPEDNIEEFTLLSEEDLTYLERAAGEAASTGRAVVGKFGAGFGDIAIVPGVGLKHPRGIRDVAEWYMSIRARPEYIQEVFSRQCDILIENLGKARDRMHHLIDVLYLCGTDFGTQRSTFCSADTFRNLWLPYYKRVNDWVHRNTQWKTFKHSCGSVVKFIDLFLEAGFDILNPVQVSAAGMDPRYLKSTFGDRIVFWGGGVDTQKTLAFGTPDEVREQALRHCEIFSQGGGYVFNTVHNVQARTPVENIVAMFDAVHEFQGRAAVSVQ